MASKDGRAVELRIIRALHCVVGPHGVTFFMEYRIDAISQLSFCYS